MAITTVSSRQFNQDTSAAKKSSANGPVIITHRGKPAHVLLTIEQYSKLAEAKKGTIIDLVAAPEGMDLDIEFPRFQDHPRPADLS